MPEVDDLGFGRQGLQEGSIVGGGGGRDDPDVGAQLPDMCDFACELRLQCDLAALRHAAEIEGLQRLAPGVVEGNRAAGGLAPGGLGTEVADGDCTMSVGDTKVHAGGNPDAMQAPERMVPLGAGVRRKRPRMRPVCSATPNPTKSVGYT